MIDSKSAVWKLNQAVLYSSGTASHFRIVENDPVRFRVAGKVLHERADVRYSRPTINGLYAALRDLHSTIDSCLPEISALEFRGNFTDAPNSPLE